MMDALVILLRRLRAPIIQTKICSISSLLTAQNGIGKSPMRIYLWRRAPLKTCIRGVKATPPALRHCHTMVAVFSRVIILETLIEVEQRGRSCVRSYLQPEDFRLSSEFQAWVPTLPERQYHPSAQFCYPEGQDDAQKLKM